MTIASIVFITILLVLQAYFAKHAPKWVQLGFWLIWTAAFAIFLWWIVFGNMHVCRFLCN